MGPISIFDKSFLHALTVDEAAVFDALYTSNITPLFFVEVLADLAKISNDSRTPEEIVGNLADKTPQMHSYPNVHHVGLCTNELFGSPIEMRGVPVVAGGRPVRSDDKHGVVFDTRPEMEALSRWQDHRFLEVERRFAAGWREAIKNLPRGVEGLVGADGKKLKLADLTAVADRVREILDEDRQRWAVLKAAMDLLGLQPKEQRFVAERWKHAGRPKIGKFAPYCAHLLFVELLFLLGAATGKVPAERQTNRIDLAYFHYTPFCEVFISGDRLHRLLAPHILTGKQKFVWAHDLKAELGGLVEHYRGHPEIHTEGLMRVASTPPQEGDRLTAQLFDIYRPSWRERASKPAPVLKPERHAKIMQEFEAMKAAPTRPGLRGRPPEPDQMVYERKVSPRRGRWQFLPAGIKPGAD